VSQATMKIGAEGEGVVICKQNWHY